MNIMKLYWVELLFILLTIGGLLLFIIDSAQFSHLTPLFLLANILFLILRLGNSKTVWKMIAIATVIGYVTEMIGVQTGLLFGDYSYNSVLGVKFFNLPLMIGPMWALVMLSIWSILKPVSGWIKIPLAGLLATAYDIVLEHFATRFNLWNWDGSIPLFNYISWFFVASLIAACYYFLQLHVPKRPIAYIILLGHLIFFTATVLIAA